MPPAFAFSDLGYTEAQRRSVLEADELWRGREWRPADGPLRTARGHIAAVPAFMRLDFFTDRQGPVPEARPDLGRCWVWTGSLTNGYGYVRVGQRKVQAYRVNYERFVGPIPAGLLLDHLCRVRRCVHPLHVEPATYSENATRSPLHSSSVKAARTHCPEGHEFTEANTYITPPDGARRCRACQAAQTARYKAERQAEATVSTA